MYLLIPRSVLPVLLIAMLVCSSNTLRAQEYPNKPLRIVTGGVGGGTDAVARLTAQAILAGTGHQAIVDNRASGLIPGMTAANAPHDGYTLLVAGGSLWIERAFQELPYDPVRDFSPITLVSSQPNILVVLPSLKVKSVKELIAVARARAGSLNYASSGAAAGSTQLAAILFKAMAAVDIVRINYKTGAQRMADLLSGAVQMNFGTANEMMPHIKSGKLVALAITSAKPSALFPDWPTVAASGLPGYEVVTMTGMFAPIKTPASIVNRLNRVTTRFLATEDVKERLLSGGVEPVGSSPEEFSAVIKSDIAKWSKLVRDTGIRTE